MILPLLTYGTTDINYVLYSQNRKDIKISVDLVNGVEVYTPENLEGAKVKELIKKKSPWILTKLRELNEVQISVQPKEFVSGEKFPYLGRHYRLKVHKEPIEKAKLQFKQGKFIAVVLQNWSQEQTNHFLEGEFIQWYRTHGTSKIKERADKYQAILGVQSNSISLRTQHKRWGTCTPSGDIYINWRLVMAPVKVMDYVIVHELVHLLVAEHNEHFWKTVQSILPDYQQRKEWLRVHGMELHNIG
ncbi:M48 family metallopeptidase [Halobacillus ihumii]|uniref:M48 family metallopeptidase n=1 Tax=Halobacillus ihumii TaxID=2686092 RepID=UPI001F071A31|nr:SprT family zinc-dependent metalloprotease [Halobacillus ihumii]